ncbi:MAG: TerD family protein, partial [Eggerthellaceae bacterium]|nr:TerD family protein [Eggerthellaceae bacterium]
TGKKVRAFTYWEEVDDIDLSCLALYDDGSVKEYSWRNMHEQQSDAITFSGDQTSGFDGGSEFFDVDLARFAEEVGPGCGYLVFCDNVYSKSTFDACICRAGYMVRDIEDSGEVFEPATVQTSFVVNCSSRSAFLFALDLRNPAIIWLNLGEQSMQRIAGEGDITFLERYLHIVDIMNLRSFACLLATDVVSTPAEADVVFSDEQPEALELREGQELIRSHDTARILELLN